MTIRNFEIVSYIPILSLRPAEMRALQQLPNRDKDLLLPLIPFGPWVGAHYLESALLRVEEAFGQRSIIADLSSDQPDSARRPVHDEMDNLRNSYDGYRSWCEFVAERSNLIPTIQIADLTQLRTQAQRLAALDRGVVLRVPELALGQAPALARVISEFFDPSSICVLLDYERQTREILTRQAGALGIVTAVQTNVPGCYISISASSFPDGFVGISDQQIYERQFFNGIINRAPFVEGLFIYSDRGSARVERQSGGGGQPAPRVDYPSVTDWYFFREETDGDRQIGYQAAARRTMAAPSWDGALRLWGTQMIERTAGGDTSAIIAASKSTAVRINIHLHQQLHYGESFEQSHDTDDDWSD